MCDTTEEEMDQRTSLRIRFPGLEEGKMQPWLLWPTFFLLCLSSWEQQRYNGVRTEFSHAWPVAAGRPRWRAAPERTVYIKEREGGQRGPVIAGFHLYTLHFLSLCSLCVFCLCVSVCSYIFLTAWFGSSLADVSAA